MILHGEQGLNIPVGVILDNMVVAVVLVDEDGFIGSFNSEAERLFQYRAEEVLGKSIDLLMPKSLFERAKPFSTAELSFAEEENSGLDEAGDIYAKRKDGSLFPFELGVNHTQIDNQPLRLGIIRDISKRVAAQKQLLSEKRRLEAVMATVVEGILIFDRNGLIQAFNRSAERIFGFEEKEVVGQPISRLFVDVEEQFSTPADYISHHFDSDINKGKEVQARRKDNEVFPAELGVNQMVVDGERLFVGSVHDISERKESDLAIQEYVKLLKRSNKELDEFAYIASHDLKEPLRGLSNNSLFLEEDYAEQLDDDGRKRLSRMRFLCNRLEKLIDNLLYFSRLGRQELAVQRVNLGSIVDDVVTLLQTNLEEVNADVYVEPNLPEVKCDVPRITEVFHNLITNALKYNDKEEKKIFVGSRQVEIPGHPGELETALYVGDNGIGIDSQFHESVFRIFKRLNHEKDETKGTGVGLTFVKKIVERHGGRIWIESEVGEGTTFLFTLHHATTPHQVNNPLEED